jgi:DNA polymerase IV
LTQIVYKLYDRAILHLDLDAFFVAVEVLRNSSLAGKPLIIGGTSRRGVVSSCSYEARRFGVHSAMPMQMALKLCPDAIVLRGDMEEYSKQSQIITQIVDSEAPLFEKASIDEFYVDMTGMDKYIGAYKWAGELCTKIAKESGLPLTYALSVNKLVSKIGAGEVKPLGKIMVDPGIEKEYIAPLSTMKLPSIGKETYKKLSFMGVRTIKLLSEIPPKLLENEFGKNGISLWKKANAKDNSPVVPYHDQKSLSNEHTFQIDTTDVRILQDNISAMVTKLAFELRNQQKLAACVTIKIRYTDFNTYTKQLHIPYTAHDGTLKRYAQEIFLKLYDRRQLVRLIGVRFSDLVSGSPQISLFDDTERDISLLQQMDKIRKRFGSEAVGWGTGKPKRPSK